MTANPQWGSNAELGGKVLPQAIVTTQAPVSSAVLDLARGQAVADMENDGAADLLPRIAADGYKLRQGELAFIVDGEDGVRTSLNGVPLFGRFARLFPGQPELVRQLISESCRVVGFVYEEPKMDEQTSGSVQVTLVTGGTQWACAPPAYNFGSEAQIANRTSRHIVQSSTVVAAVPSLIDPKMPNPPNTVQTPGKVGFVFCAQDKRSDAARVTAMLGAARDNADTFKLALDKFTRVKTIWMHVTSSVTRSYDTALVLGVETLLRAGYLAPGANSAGLFVGIAAAGPDASFAQAVRLAEMLDVVTPSSVMLNLSSADVKRAKETAFEVRRRMLPLASQSSGAYNVVHQFGSKPGTTASFARENGTGVIKSDGAGQLLNAANTHFATMLDSLAVANHEETDKLVGSAVMPPATNKKGAGLFRLMVSSGGSINKN